MKHQEVKFRCDTCKVEVEYKATYSCPNCGKYLGWGFINRVYSDKYMEIYEVGV